jgi:hypothetical protein
MMIKKQYRLVSYEVLGLNRKDWWLHIQIKNAAIYGRDKKLKHEAFTQASEIFKAHVCLERGISQNEVRLHYYADFKLDNHTMRYQIWFRTIDRNYADEQRILSKFRNNCKTVRAVFEEY